MKKALILMVVLFFIGLVPIGIYAQSKPDVDFHDWALTPPMGWNSWDCFGPSVMEDEVKANADYMAENLKEYGWEYVVVDIRWYINNQFTGHYNPYDNSDFEIDAFGRYMPSPNRFPSAAKGKGFKPLADYVHRLGLKFGIHIMRGVPKEAVYNKMPIKGTEITADQIYSTAWECTWLKDNYTVLKEKEGAQEYYNSILDLYASWGVDYIKVDDLSRPYHADEIEMLRNAIDQTGRPIVLSMSPGATPLDQHEHAKNHANLWRTIDDFWDNWSQLNYSFGKCAEWAPYITPGSWPDADMLPLGHLSIRGERGADRYSNFTKDEQYTLMTLWTIFKSPLMFGGHLPDNDEFTNSLLTNKEVLQMHSTSVNNKEWFNKGNIIAWTADDPESGDKYLALFNNEGDGFVNTKNLLYRSGTVSTLTDGFGVDIDLAVPEGSKELYLIVNDNGDGISCDHANWINPTIYLENGDSVGLTSMDWESATIGWNSIKVDQSVTGGPLNVKGKTYDTGIGTHSQSIIKYIIPDNSRRFMAFAGLDIVGVEEACGSTVEFMIANQDPTPNANNVEFAEVNIKLKDLGFKKVCCIRDLWQQEDVGEFSNQFKVSIPSHGARLYRISAK
ncbi:NPCBM/NEW2 domain-containing protein [Marinoscillum sp. MHG1-6]|uniref:NPCBM/NEW2 domain-containing protein n=1 Tax=Marinoscillum sp. MHG1-6 TaxID=2959627 RepID=UPI0021586E74|nr:NPCBM/NEW2 domain-containing protein [Marinoscillum sp. MHG1-6]